MADAPQNFTDMFKNLVSLPAELSSRHCTLCVIIHIEEIRWTIKHCDFYALGLLDFGRLVPRLDLHSCLDRKSVV